MSRDRGWPFSARLVPGASGLIRGRDSVTSVHVISGLTSHLPTLSFLPGHVEVAGRIEGPQACEGAHVGLGRGGPALPDAEAGKVGWSFLLSLELVFRVIEGADMQLLPPLRQHTRS